MIWVFIKLYYFIIWFLKIIFIKLVNCLLGFMRIWLSFGISFKSKFLSFFLRSELLGEDIYRKGKFCILGILGWFIICGLNF